MKKILTHLFLACASICNAQVIVSGGIFSNTTWSAPTYLVTGNVIVFPGVTLNIMPGVTVKFTDSTQLEIRQGYLNANGTKANPIIFTSSSASPVTGGWKNIYDNQSPRIKLNHCNVSWAQQGLTGTGDSLILLNSTFTKNTRGSDAYTTSYSFVDSCSFRDNDQGQWLYNGTVRHTSYVKNNYGLNAWNGVTVSDCVIDSNDVGTNPVGLYMVLGCNDTIKNCLFRGNNIALQLEYGCIAQLGLWMNGNTFDHNFVATAFYPWSAFSPSLIKIQNNCFCNSGSYNFQNLTSQNLDLTNNSWCTNDSASIQLSVYDFHNNTSDGLVTFMPLDTSKCTLVSGINEILPMGFSFYPNPACTNISLSANLDNGTVLVTDLMGNELVRRRFLNNNTVLNVSWLPAGIYFVHVIEEGGRSSKKLIIEK